MPLVLITHRQVKGDVIPGSIGVDIPFHLPYTKLTRGIQVTTADNLTVRSVLAEIDQSVS